MTFIPPPITRFEATICAIRTLTPDTKEFELVVPTQFTFEPGQFVTLLIEKEGKVYRRLYSIASAPNQTHEKENTITLCIKYIPDGKITPIIFEYTIGQKIACMGPQGVFVLKDKTKPLVLISTGTGIAPFYSMIQHYHTTCKITLLCGYRHHIIYDKQLQSKQITYIPVLSKAQVSHALPGRVTDHLQKAYDPNAIYYICGLSEMITQVATKLVELGIHRTQIHFERYD
jgi:ferredoxin-NADP reductase